MAKTRKRHPKGNYQKAILEAWQDGHLSPQAGQVTHLDIYHDDNCAIFRGGPCDCDPAIFQRPEPAKAAAD